MAAATAGVNLDQALSDRRELNTIKRRIGAHEMLQPGPSSVTSVLLSARQAARINVASAERIIHDDDGAGFDMPQGNG
jgi:hypothetical protein